MIDIERRKQLALHLRHLSVGLITNDDFEGVILEEVSDGWLPEQYYRSKRVKMKDEDPIIRPMLELCWGLYDDTREHTVKLSSDSLKVIARCILFLRSKKEYEWPYFNTRHPILQLSFTDLILSVLTLGHHYRDKKEEHLISYFEWQKMGDYDFWPFIKESDFQEELNNQPFLNGQQK
jgi:hypothetical protein